MRPGAPRIELVFFDAGGGHRNAMRALSTMLARTEPGWSLAPLDLQALLQGVDPVYLATSIKSQDVYNSALRRGWTRGSATLLRGLQQGIRLHAPLMERPLARHWRQSPPDLVVSLVPNFNGVMYRTLRRVLPGTPFVTILTDIADTPPHFWLEPQDQHVICGSAKAELQAHLTGFYRRERIHRTSGMLLHPDFYDPPPPNRPTRATLGLDPHRATALIMFGGNGSQIAADILDRLDEARLDVQAIVLCGRNTELLRALEGRPGFAALPFTDRVVDYMRLADFFIGKPGPGSLSEALHCGLPVIVDNNARTLVQERYNAIWVEGQGVGLAVTTFADIAKAVAFLLHGDTLAAYRTRAHALENRAIFEVPVILKRILATRATDHDAASAAGSAWLQAG